MSNDILMKCKFCECELNIDNKVKGKNRCKPCNRIEAKRYYEANRDEMILRAKLYREENHELRKEYDRKYSENNKDKIKDKTKEYYSRPEVKEKQRIRNLQPEVQERRKEYQSRSDVKERAKEKMRVYNARPEVIQRKKEMGEQIVSCECGQQVRKYKMKNHLTYNSHLDWMKKSMK